MTPRPTQPGPLHLMSPAIYADWSRELAAWSVERDQVRFREVIAATQPASTSVDGLFQNYSRAAKPKPPSRPAWAADATSYHTYMKREQRKRDKANPKPCVDCGKPRGRGTRCTPCANDHEAAQRRAKNKAVASRRALTREGLKQRTAA